MIVGGGRRRGLREVRGFKRRCASKVCHLVLVVVIVAGLVNVLVDDDDDADGGGAKCSVPDGTTIISSLPSSSVCCGCITCIGSIPIGCCGSLAHVHPRNWV